MVSARTNAMTYQCPVCGYDELTQSPENFSICECCGTEFESDDFDRSHAELRRDWITNNMPWFSRAILMPKNWSPDRQLIIADHGIDLITHPRFKAELDFRSEVNKAFSEVFISKQLKALRERKEEPLTQTQRADKAGMKQSRISELEGMNYSSWSISTLERLAKALGVAFTYSFEAWSDLVSRIEQGLSAEVLAIPSFEHDIAVTNQVVLIKKEGPPIIRRRDVLYGLDSVSAVLLPSGQLGIDDILRSALFALDPKDPDVQEYVMIEDEPSSTPTFFEKSSGPESLTSLAIN
jgi:hypothetical protein